MEVAETPQVRILDRFQTWKDRYQMNHPRLLPYGKPLFLLAQRAFDALSNNYCKLYAVGDTRIEVLPWYGEFRTYALLVEPDTAKFGYRALLTFNHPMHNLKVVPGSKQQLVFEGQLIRLTKQLNKQHKGDVLRLVELELVDVEDQGYALVVKRLVGDSSSLKWGSVLLTTSDKSLSKTSEVCLGVDQETEQPIAWIDSKQKAVQAMQEKLCNALKLLPKLRKVTLQELSKLTLEGNPS